MVREVYKEHRAYFRDRTDPFWQQIMSSRQEVLNVFLASLLQDRDLVAAPEQVIAGVRRKRNMPDVIVDFRGLRLQIECEFAGKRPADARAKALAKAKERVEHAIAHIGVAVVYPTRLRDVPFDALKLELAGSPLEYSVVTEAVLMRPNDQLQLFALEPESSFSKGTVDDLGDALRRYYEQLVRDETLDRAVSLIEARVGEFLASLAIQGATAVRMARVLGIEDLPDNATVLRPKQRIAVGKISALIIVNALIFQEVLSQNDARVPSLHDSWAPSGLVSSVGERWQYILDKINYYPIFYTARRLLSCLSADTAVDESLGRLKETALSVVGWRASLRHDLAGRIYHRLLEEAKSLGAYYTSIPSAALLLKLALRPERYGIDWSTSQGVSSLRIADLACGTGTLLMAAADSVIDNHVRLSAVAGATPNSSEVNRSLAADVLYGYDVLPSAIHLTASTLSLRVPETPLDRMNLFRVLHGGESGFLGTLEAFEPSGARATLFSQPDRSEHVTAYGVERVVQLALPSLDLCVMNPPFTSSRKGNRLFGSVPDSQRKMMQARLKSIVRDQKLLASATAGLGSLFVALGDRQLRPGGRLALVLPKSILSGISWEPSREMMALGYVLEYVLVSHEFNHWNFSENTDLAEAMLVARKLNTGEVASNSADVVYVNLWQQPKTATEALSLAHVLSSQAIAPLSQGRNVTNLTIDSKKYGEAYTVKWGSIRSSSWAFPCSYAKAELTAAFVNLVAGNLQLPLSQDFHPIPLRRLSEIATLGPDPRDVYDGFELAGNERTAYPAMWHHDADQIRSMAGKPNMYLRPLAKPAAGRKLRGVGLLWPKAGRILVAMRIRLNTKRIVAMRLSDRVLSDVWWPVTMKVDIEDIDQAEKCLVLWLNSTLGLLILIGSRLETEGAWVQYKKPMWERMPVLDIAALSKGSRDRLVATYDRLCGENLGTLPNLTDDAVRIAIDTSISSALGIPDLAPLRFAISNEPLMCQDMNGILVPHA